MRKSRKFLLIILMIGFVFQASISVFAMVNDTTTESTIDPKKTEAVEISEDVLNQLKDANPDDYLQDIDMYKSFIVKLNVHEILKKSIDQFILDDYALSDIFVGYEYVYHHFGVLEDLEAFLIQRNEGLEWMELFTEYQASHAEFVPRAFDSQYLEQLNQTPELTSDDIMIADMVSFVSDKPVEDVVELKLEINHWNQMTAQEGILYSADTLPRVQITMEQIEKYTASTQLTEDQVVQTFIVAHKLGESAESLIERVSSGESEESIFAEVLVGGYRYE